MVFAPDVHVGIAHVKACKFRVEWVDDATAKSWTSTDSGNLEMNSTRGNADNWFEPDIKSIVCNTATNDLIKDSQASENFGNLP